MGGVLDVRLGADAPRAIARRFAWFAWGAYVVLLATGVWNLLAIGVGSASDEYLTTLFVKLGLVAVSLSGLAALGALFLGVVLRGG